MFPPLVCFSFATASGRGPFSNSAGFQSRSFSVVEATFFGSVLNRSAKSPVCFGHEPAKIS
jgi:hypothetical protein